MTDPEREQLEREIKELNDQLRSTSEASRLYLQNVAHQLTAPLGAIKWSIEALKDPTIPIARKGSLLSSVYSQAGILVHLIKNFSLMSNLEADKELGQLRNQEPTDLMLLAINLANDFQPQAKEGEKEIAVDEDSFGRALLGRKVIVEKNLVAQAASNLLENAVKYGDSHTTINISGRRLDERVGLSVTSVGLPISEEEKAGILERGFRGEAAKQRVATGTGIGLYLAARVMSLHEGEILVEVKGRTSCLTLVFPKARIK